MPPKTRSSSNKIKALSKTATGIKGLDEITGGGLPRGRPTLVCGAAGCGKTLLASEFIVRGALQFGEPGVFMAFEEKAEELEMNMASLGFDLRKLQKDGLVKIDMFILIKAKLKKQANTTLMACLYAWDMPSTL